MNIYLKVAAIINFIIGGFFTLLGIPGDIPFLLGYGIFELGIGFVYYQSNKLDIEELYNRRVWLLILAIVNVLFNLFSSIFIFIAYDHIKMEYKKKKKKRKKTKKDKINEEKRKLDTLLKMGVGLILLSGIIFMNSSMFQFTGWVKFLFLLILSVLFYGLYLFSEKYLKIQNTTWGYHLLSMFFLLLAYFIIPYEDVFGTWIGNYIKIHEMTFFILFSFLCYTSYKKFNHSLYLFGFYLGSFFALWSFLDIINIPYFMEIVCMELVISLLSMLDFSKKEEKKIFMYFLLFWTYILSFYYIDASVVNDQVMCVFAGFLLLGNMYLLTLSNEESWAPILTTLCSVPILPTMVSILNLSISNQVWVLTFSYCFIFGILLLNKYTIKKVLFHNLTTLVLNLSLFGVYVYAYQVNVSLALMVSFALLFLNFMYLTVFDSKKTIEYYLQPVKTSILIYTCLRLLKPIFILDNTLIFSIISMLLLLIVHLRMEHELKWDYFITYLISMFITFMVSICNGGMVGSLLVLILIVYTSIYTYQSKEIRVHKLYPLIYGWTLLMIYELISIQNVFAFPQVMSDILVILMFIIGMVANMENKKIFTATSLAILLPIYELFKNLVMEELARNLFVHLIFIYLIMWFSEKVIKKEKDRNVFSAVMIAVLLLTFVFNTNWLVGLYISLVTLTLMVYSTYKEGYNYVFNVSFVFFILNLITHLYFFWKQIPFWAYLLFVGIFIIGLVTFKEVKKEKKK